MEGFKLIKTTFENNKEIVGVNFHGDESYYLFLDEVRKTYNLPEDYEIQVYSKEFIIRPNIFTNFVAQYISNLDFVLDIKGKVPLKRCNTSTTSCDSQTISSKTERSQTAKTSCDSPQLPLNTVALGRCLTPTTSCDSQQISSASEVAQTSATPSASYDLQQLLSNPSVNLQTIPSNSEIVQIPDIQEVLQLRSLENKHRTKIAKAIISKIFTDNPDVRLLREEFMQLAESIVEIFPSEVKETYYVPFTKGHLARGKLYDAYNNTRARLSASGVRRRRIRFRTSPTVSADYSNVLTYAEVEEQKLEILKIGNADWNVILEAWEKTHAFRQNEFKNENMEAFEYMEKYKVLQHKNNYQLFEIDYKMLYPQSKSIYEWKLYYHKVIDKAEKLKDNGVKEILNNITNTCEEGG
ncbi:uncharacterized protein LOC111689919 isoform X1 [Lucilia cuprina]|uniref:uncharacterized protein LOC111689919 isoform X1 n=1 Tax=Lucilia cuprina TaxID=7375 RepID=UPI001F067C40|nr:uncharacterized protein LOC111689919 isoform X1 [Lucilia cuprina]